MRSYLIEYLQEYAASIAPSDEAHNRNAADHHCIEMQYFELCTEFWVWTNYLFLCYTPLRKTQQ